MKFKLTLTTEDDIVLGWWYLIGDKEPSPALDDGYNLSYQFAKATVISEIIEEIRKAEEQA